MALVLTISGLLAILLGILVLVFPSLLRYLIGFYLIIFGALQLFSDAIQFS